MHRSPDPQSPIAPAPASKPGWLLAAGALLIAGGLFAHGTPRPNAPLAPQDPPGSQLPPTQAPMMSSGATADSNGRMIAVTGIDLTGSSILYLIDTQDPHLAIYQATGGSSSTQGVRLVGARKIDLDLRLDGFNDKSQYTYKDLERQFVENGLLPEDP
ncbi:MAG: hypothetical protein QF903_09210 [Planctomycetota bacterium]|jgi:hypothetical protein|nr:hypothetical protein [Planctomycetota bacterium]MDP6764172.1 hypothetical protein [Planctomycetota bacterium]MDP6989643.1 hypothetical protein [Planctomycetota bacterium]